MVPVYVSLIVEIGVADDVTVVGDGVTVRVAEWDSVGVAELSESDTVGVTVSVCDGVGDTEAVSDFDRGLYSRNHRNHRNDEIASNLEGVIDFVISVVSIGGCIAGITGLSVIPAIQPPIEITEITEMTKSPATWKGWPSGWIHQQRVFHAGPLHTDYRWAAAGVCC